jgi:sulfide:quinone oxidoreductase
MLIKCAGATQKAVYHSSDASRRRGVIKNINIEFNCAGGILFGVKDYIPALMDYVRKYDPHRNLFHRLVAVDGPSPHAWFGAASLTRRSSGSRWNWT